MSDTGVVDQTALAVFNGEPAEQLAAAPPPKLPPPDGADPDAPFGRKADGTARRARPGPGRGHRGKDPADKPRTGELPAGPQKPGKQSASDPRDYTEALQSAGLAVWVGLSSTPWTGAHAALWRSHVPVLADALNTGAQQNPAVRRQVEKLTGEGGWLWVLPLAASVSSLAAGSWQILKDRDLRAQLKATNDAMFEAFVEEQVKAMGLATEPDPATFQTGPDGVTQPAA
jgi:hypothetical protein